MRSVRAAPNPSPEREDGAQVAHAGDVVAGLLRARLHRARHAAHRVLAVASQLRVRLPQADGRLLQPGVALSDLLAQRVALVPLTSPQAAQFDLGQGQLGEAGQDPDLALAPAARRGVDGAQRSDGVARRGDQRYARVGAQALCRYGGVVPHQGIVARVVHHQRHPRLDREPAEGAGGRQVDEAPRETGAALEELTVVVNQAEQGDRRVQAQRGQPGDPVEGLLGLRVQQLEVVQRRQAGRVNDRAARQRRTAGAVEGHAGSIGAGRPKPRGTARIATRGLGIGTRGYARLNPEDVPRPSRRGSAAG